MCRALHNITERANAITPSSPKAEERTSKSRPRAEVSKERGEQGGRWRAVYLASRTHSRARRVLLGESSSPLL